MRTATTNSLRNETFSGIISDTDLIEGANNYVFNYHFNLIEADLRDDKCLIKNAEFGIAARTDLDQPFVDIETEKKEIDTELKKFAKLARTRPNQIHSDGLTNKEVYALYRNLLDELQKVKDILINEVKDQIIDKINAKEGSDFTEIRVENLSFVPFNRMKMSKRYKTLRQAS